MSRFLDEIHELPAALRRMTRYYSNEGAALISDWSRLAKGKKSVLFTGMGTSEFAPLVVVNQLGLLGLHSRCVDAGELLHYGPSRSGGEELTVMISQSGESVEIRKIIEEGRPARCHVAITNNVDSSLARAADLALPLCAGEEASISTKTYSNTLGLLHLLVSSLKGQEALGIALSEIELVADNMLDVDDERIREAAEFLLPTQAIVFVGRGPALVAARQCALTFMEGAHCVGSAFSGGAFRHGPLEAIDTGFRLVVFVPAGATAPLLDRLAQDCSALGARVVVLTDRLSSGSDRLEVIRVRNAAGASAEQLFPLAASGVHNLLLHHFAERRGVEAGIFRYGGKVTVHE
jgi:glucosamine--fructose-6-phosphate aminotransferase (isomerizing)